MPNPDNDLQSWFDELPESIQDDMAEPLRDAAEKLAAAIKDEAREKSGALKQSIQVRQLDDGSFEVTAGGDLTTKEVRAGSGVYYDYAMAEEFGTVNDDGHPFFYNTARRVAPELRDEIEDALNDALGE